jgi:hypothetical protein
VRHRDTECVTRSPSASSCVLELVAGLAPLCEEDTGDGRWHLKATGNDHAEASRRRTDWKECTHFQQGPTPSLKLANDSRASPMLLHESPPAATTLSINGSTSAAVRLCAIAAIVLYLMRFAWYGLMGHDHVGVEFGEDWLEEKIDRATTSRFSSSAPGHVSDGGIGCAMRRGDALPTAQASKHATDATGEGEYRRGHL